MASIPMSTSTSTRRFYIILGGLILAAWGLLAAWQSSAYAELLSHEVIEHHELPFTGRLAAFLLSWLLMTVAMMLPGSLPLLQQSIQPFRQRPASERLVKLVLLGYLFPWVLFGGLAYLGDSVLHHMAEEPAGPLADFASFIPAVIPAVILLAAGLYQLTPLKREAMRHCRPSHGMLWERSTEKSSMAGALIKGLHLGAFCVGSCGALMLLMFATGHNRLDWMLALGGIMAAERLAPWGDRLAWLVGGVLVLWAIMMMLTI